MSWWKPKVEQKKVEIILTKGANEKLRYYIEECPVEISGFGKVRELPAEEDTKKFQIYDIEILPQEVTGADANISMEDMALFLNAKMRDKKSRKTIEDYKVWWHSHATFGAFFSGTDETTIDESTEFPYLISLVGNKAGDLLGRLDAYKPFRMTFEAEVLIEEEENASLRRKVRKEIAEKVVIKGSQMGYIAGDEKDKDDPPHKHGGSEGYDYQPTRFLGSDGLWYDLEGNEIDGIEDKKRFFGKKFKIEVHGQHPKTQLDRILEKEGYRPVEDDEDEDGISRKGLYHPGVH